MAVLTTMWPDKLEKIVRVSHRGPTHRWGAVAVVPAATCALTAAILTYGFALLTPGLRLAFGDPTITLPAGVPLEHALIIGACAALGVLVGYLCHLYADGNTVSGLPIGDRKLFFAPRAFRVKTGTASEDTWRFCFTLAWLGIMYLLVWPDLQASELWHSLSDLTR